jgi:hypothetical protein
MSVFLLPVISLRRRKKKKGICFLYPPRESNTFLRLHVPPLAANILMSHFIFFKFKDDNCQKSLDQDQIKTF